ncbi:probable adenylate kinase 1, chloroplastic [Phragmites australis]|uniref:probable adenylate kinase 1, chloroplastic n=1 Tax=Phragmites australis TaxID=29695 RepID=UPI002D766425|nr:probable adenylate kinase 1, chloroplastic [Phragmites australis]
MAAVQRLFRAAASGGAARRGMTSLAPEQAPSAAAAAAGFPFAAEERMRRRPAAERNVQWVFLGCPGVGKGTYASRLSRLLGVPHIATGDLVRDELASTGSLAVQLAEIVNQGKLVSDEIIFNLLSKRLKKGEDQGESGFILDGFPRTVKQAEILDGVTDIDMVVNLKLREDVLVEKCLGRRICSQCGKNFNLACIDVTGENGLPPIYMAPLLPPNNCMSKLITRADDTEEVVRNRLQIYNDMSQPVEDFYRKQGKLLEFNLPGGIPESWPKLLHILNLEDQEEMKLATA